MRVWTFSNHPEKTHAALITITVLLSWTGMPKKWSVCPRWKCYTTFIAQAFPMHFSHAEDFQIQQETGTATNQLSANAQEQRKSKQEWKARWQYMTSCFVMRPHTISTTTLVETGHAWQQLSLTWLCATTSKYSQSKRVWLNEWQDCTITDTLTCKQDFNNLYLVETIY